MTHRYQMTLRANSRNCTFSGKFLDQNAAHFPKHPILHQRKRTNFHVSEPNVWRWLPDFVSCKVCRTGGLSARICRGVRVELFVPLSDFPCITGQWNRFGTMSGGLLCTHLQKHRKKKSRNISIGILADPV